MEVNMEGKDALWTIDEVADRLRIHPNTAYLMAQRGAFRGAFKVNREWRIPLKGLEEYIATSAARVAQSQWAGSQPAQPIGDRAAERPGGASSTS
jgi:excisionase family DNA binding protein